ncbi:MAG: polymer-forming cytoskeletal family protein [Spirochaetaceae bacterium]|nr:MAG: polymer-forming cytoskeletal family protein [Spirochaetaceae bacterium]
MRKVHDVESDLYVNSIVGEGSRFRGHLELSGLMRIDGDYSGSVKTDGKVIVGRNGRADCTIEASTVVIGGVFRGNVYATDKVIVLSAALVLGNLYTPRLVAEEGVLLDGAIMVSGTPSPVGGDGENARSSGLIRRRTRKHETSSVGTGTPAVK